MTVYDIIGVGIGPFNLSLAALLDGTDEASDALFLEQDPEFEWHEGMLISGTDLQIPFIGDLVSITDPTNPHSFLNYIRKQDRMWEFYNYQQFKLPRREYNEYCKWVADRLASCQFSQRVSEITETSDGHYRIETTDPRTSETATYETEHIALGVGSKPFVPEHLEDSLGDGVFHSSTYLDERDQCLDSTSITVVGSGQSGAEIVLDLLRKQESADFDLQWLTRSDGFYPVDPSKLTRDVRTPDYVEYFYDLPADVREERLATQDLLYKGISPGTSEAIYNTLYRRSITENPDVAMMPTTSVESITPSTDRSSPDYRLACHHWEEDRRFTIDADAVVLATGYHRPFPSFLEPLRPHLELEDGELQVTEDFRVEREGDGGDIFVQNAGLHAHGFNVPDLSVGCYRNARIINTLLGETVYPAGDGSRFQTFGVDEFVEESSNADRPQPTPQQ